MEESLAWMLGGLAGAGTLTSALIGYLWITDAIVKRRAPKLDAEYGARFRENYALMERAVKRQDYGEAEEKAHSIGRLAYDLNDKCFGIYTAYACPDIRQIIKKAEKLQPSMSTLECMVRGNESNNFF